MSSKLVVLCQAGTIGPKGCHGIHHDLPDKTISYGGVLSMRLTFTNCMYLYFADVFM